MVLDGLVYSECVINHYVVFLLRIGFFIIFAVFAKSYKVQIWLYRSVDMSILTLLAETSRIFV